MLNTKVLLSVNLWYFLFLVEVFIFKSILICLETLALTSKTGISTFNLLNQLAYSLLKSIIIVWLHLNVTVP